MWKLLVWVLFPILLIGGGAIAFVMWRRSKKPAAPPPAQHPASPPKAPPAPPPAAGGGLSLDSVAKALPVVASIGSALYGFFSGGGDLPEGTTLDTE